MYIDIHYLCLKILQHKWQKIFITESTALRIKIDKQWAIIFEWDNGDALNVEPEFWLNLQRDFDLWRARAAYQHIETFRSGPAHIFSKRLKSA